MKHETAGDPMSGLKWTHRTTEKIAAQLRSLKINVSPRTVAKLLIEMGFSLRVNHKKLSSGSPERRDEQFTKIALYHSLGKLPEPDFTHRFFGRGKKIKRTIASGR